MTKQRWKGSMKSFKNHLDPELEEQLKWIKIEIENNVRRSLKLIKTIHPSREGNLRRKTELIQLVEDIRKEYQSLYALYDNLRGEIRKKIRGGEEGSSSHTSSSDSESYYSPVELHNRNHESSSKHKREAESSNPKPESPESEDAILKDKLTSTSEVKKSLSLGSLSSFGEASESGEIIKELGKQAEQSQITIENLLDECEQVKEKLVEREVEILSIAKKQQAFGEEKFSQIKDLESQVSSLKLELETMSSHKKAFEEQIECKSNEAKKLTDENSALLARILELEAISQDKEGKFSSLPKESDQDDEQSLSEFKDPMAHANNLQLELDSLRSQKRELERQLANETTDKFAQVNGLTAKINGLQQELELLSGQKTQLELELKEKSEDVSECLSHREKLTGNLANQTLHVEEGTKEEKEDLQVKVKDLKLEVKSLSRQKSDLELQLISFNDEACHLRGEKEQLHRKIFELEATQKEREDDLSTLQMKFKAQRDEMDAQVKSLTAQIERLQQQLETLQTEKTGLQTLLDGEKKVSSQSLTHMERKNIELTNKIADQQKSLTELEDVIKKLNEELEQVQTQLAESRSNYQIAERRIEEMADEFVKKFEDNLRILSRRIRVAEQLQVEGKEWYKKTKYSYEQQNKDLKERMGRNEVNLRNIKDLSLKANEMLSALDSVALKYEECTANFLNRTSKVSCELKFAQDWVMRKNKAMIHVKDDLDCLLVQLDDKEAEILVFREKVWKSENKVRELEKMIKLKEDAMLALKEEKREAIRQLCVWIDYHRSRSDYYKKMLSDITARYRRAP